jgi:hypothetical protein
MREEKKEEEKEREFTTNPLGCPNGRIVNGATERERERERERDRQKERKRERERGYFTVGCGAPLPWGPRRLNTHYIGTKRIQPDKIYSTVRTCFVRFI